MGAAAPPGDDGAGGRDAASRHHNHRTPRPYASRGPVARDAPCCLHPVERTRRGGSPRARPILALSIGSLASCGPRSLALHAPRVEGDASRRRHVGWGSFSTLRLAGAVYSARGPPSVQLQVSGAQAPERGHLSRRADGTFPGPSSRRRRGRVADAVASQTRSRRRRGRIPDAVASQTRSRLVRASPYGNDPLSRARRWQRGHRWVPRCPTTMRTIVVPQRGQASPSCP